jgi:hypothetical protein
VEVFPKIYNEDWFFLWLNFMSSRKPITGRQASDVEVWVAVETSGREPGGGALARLVDQLGEAARADWGPTSRMVVLLAAASGAIALILLAGR